jgi:hypothetical protein
VNAPASSPPARPAPARILIGWREWLGLPQLGVACIRAKVDSGARSSSLHVLDQELFERDGRAHVRFTLEHGPRDELRHRAEAEVIDRRQVTDSGGHRQLRVFIRTRLSLPTGPSWLIEVNLTERHNMQFPMLLGRSALRRRCLVEPARSFLLGVPAEDQSLP